MERKKIYFILFCFTFTVSHIKLALTTCLTEQTDFSVNYATNGDFAIPNLAGGWRALVGTLYGWSSRSIQQGAAQIYNTNWPSSWQVIELDTFRNEMYNQTITLPKCKFLFTVSYAARMGCALSSSGIRIWWNGQILLDIQSSLDYNIHTQTYIVNAIAGSNLLILQGRGTSEGVGMSCTNIKFNKIQQFNRDDLNGTCLCKQGYFDNFVNYTCQPCNQIDSQCLLCNYNNNTNININNNNSYNNNNNNSNINQSYQYTCLQCQIGYYIFNNYCISCENSIKGCINCSKNGQYCYICNETQNYTLINYKLCSQCYLCSCYNNILNNNNINNILPNIYYNQQQCYIQNILNNIIFSIVIISYIIMFFSLLSIKIIGIQLFGVLQLAYFNIIDNQYINLYLMPFLQWRYINGYNLIFQHTSINIIPKIIQAINYNVSFISNMNIMLGLLLGQFIISLILVFLSQYILKIRRISKFLFKQVFLTLFLFNSFNIIISFTLHFKYTTYQNTNYYILSTIFAIIAFSLYFIIIFLLQFTKSQQFGQYKNKFKQDCINQKYIFITIIYKFILGIYIVISNQQIYGTLIIIFINLIFILYNIINLPFKDTYHNYRANLCHFTQLIILVVTNYYRSMKYYTNLEVKAKIYIPAIIQISFIIICVVISAICLIYQIYHIIKNAINSYKRNKKILNISENNKENKINKWNHTTQQSIMAINDRIFKQQQR